jgi:anti-sigma regulatory factor (Ser/Thr protein kinase)
MRDFVSERSDGVVTIHFSATAENVDRAWREVERAFVAPAGSLRIFPVQLLFREALNNAVFHGSHCDTRKKVKCRVVWSDKMGVTITVEDSGEGFDWRFYRNRLPDDHACSGRGLAIMERYAKKIVFNEKGNGVVLEIDLSHGGT